MHSFRRGVFLLWALLAIVPCSWVTADDEPTASLPLSAHMNWDQIYTAMEAFPPSYTHGDQRKMIMQSMDRLIDFSVKHISTEQRVKVEPQLAAMVHFYRRRGKRKTEQIMVYCEEVLPSGARGPTILLDHARLSPHGNVSNPF